jgi:hypothetical protein
MSQLIGLNSRHNYVKASAAFKIFACRERNDIIIKTVS